MQVYSCIIPESCFFFLSWIDIAFCQMLFLYQLIWSCFFPLFRPLYWLVSWTIEPALRSWDKPHLVSRHFQRLICLCCKVEAVTLTLPHRTGLKIKKERMCEFVLKGMCAWTQSPIEIEAEKQPYSSKLLLFKLLPNQALHETQWILQFCVP